MKTFILSIFVAIGLGLNAIAAAPPKTRPNPTMAAVQPLTYSNVISQFKAAKLRAIEVQKRCTIFFEGEWAKANIYNYAVVLVENSDEDIQVTFYLTDAHEMNWVTEFLDAPFFAQSETKELFGLMNSDRDVRNRRIGRFRVDYHRWEPKHAQIIVFSFTPVRQLGSSST